MDGDGFPLRSFWSTPPGAQRLRQSVSPGKVALLGFQWMCALLVFVSMSSQRAGLWGPSPAACALCNGTGPGGQCTTGHGGPHGLGCPYTAFGQFQFLCAVGIMWWMATGTLLLFACVGRNPPLMTEFLIYFTFSVLTCMALASSVAMCSSQPVMRGVSVCTAAGAAKMACWFAAFMWGAQLLSCYWCFKDWRYNQFEGLPPRMSASLSKMRGGASSSSLLFTGPGGPGLGLPGGAPGLGGSTLPTGYQSINTAHSI